MVDDGTGEDPVPFQLRTSKAMNVLLLIFVIGLTAGQGVQKSVIDFSKAKPNPKTGQLCVLQEVCIADASALVKLLPMEPCLPEGCNCQGDSDCGGGQAKCVACKCMECPVSAAASQGGVINPPLTFLIDTTKSVKPDKDSIFNLTRRVVERIEETDTNIPNYLLVTFNDLGTDIKKNVKVYPSTNDVQKFKKDALDLLFESYDGGRDSKERLTQGLMVASQVTQEKSLIVVFTDNGSKDLKLEREIMRIKNEKNLEIYIVLTPEYEGFPNAPSLDVYARIGVVFKIDEVGADSLIQSVEEFEEGNCV